MAATPGNRKKFIDSLIKFMRTYGFDGADFDWEYPGADGRGGKPEDGDNFVQLVKEMKEAFGGSYGMSVTLPTSYWYLRHFKVKEMEPYIGWYVPMYSLFCRNANSIIQVQRHVVRYSWCVGLE
jgi:chitinase